MVSEGATFEGGEMMFEGAEKDAYGHAKLGGIGDMISAKLKELSPKYNKGRAIETITSVLNALANTLQYTFSAAKYYRVFEEDRELKAALKLATHNPHLNWRIISNNDNVINLR